MNTYEDWVRSVETVFGSLSARYQYVKRVNAYACANCNRRFSEHTSTGQCLFAPTKFVFTDAALAHASRHTAYLRRYAAEIEARYKERFG